MTKNKQLLKFVDDSKNLCLPDRIVWIDGSKKQLDALYAEAVASGELKMLDPKTMPECYIGNSHPSDVARVEERTFICSKSKSDAGPTNNWMEPETAYDKLKKIYNGCMKGRTMYVIPFSMGVPGSPFTKIGIEITDSLIVVLHMSIMARTGVQCLETLGNSNDFVRGLHSKATLNAEERYIMHFPEDNTIWSINSNYGGNVLLGKKCFALRIASYQGKKEGWMAEHMVIIGLQKPDGETKYIAAAFPSACGKTNLAMMIPPEGFIQDGYKIFCIGDDIAWLRKGSDGRLWAVNPEYGFFGVAPGTSLKTNPNAMATIQKGTIYTNVVHDLDTNTVWWEGKDKNPPENGLDWKGNPWNGKTATEKGAHPNSRFTASTKNCPCVSPEYENPQGVPISAIIFGGRRAKLIPLVYAARDWNHGVFIGASMASETTAAQVGAVGNVRRDPNAMLPFIGYHVMDYFQHWFDMGKSLAKPPNIYGWNVFQLDENGNFRYPGFGENIRQLIWIANHCDGKVKGNETMIGVVPKKEEFNAAGIDVDFDKLFEINPKDWAAEAKDIEEYFGKLEANGGKPMPELLKEQLNILKTNVSGGK